jgi:cytochrome c biogenesis protein ResB
MSVRNNVSTILLNTISSSRLALVLVLLVILFSLSGAVLPQEGAMDRAEIELWQNANPRVTAILEPVGLFRVFHSWPFLVTIFVLAVNTLTCTVLRFFEDGGLAAFKGSQGVGRAGFVLLHLSLVLLFAGGGWSAAAKLDGYIVLTEGQSFTERHDQYLRLVEGPLRRENHREFVVVLNSVKTEYENNKYPIYSGTNLDIIRDNKTVAHETVEINKPFTYNGVSFTQDETGFSPRLTIRDKRSGRLLLDSFVALKTFRTEQGRQYRDFLPLPFFTNRVVVTLYPSYSHEDGRLVKTGEEPDNPLLLIEQEDESGRVVSRTELPAGEKAAVADYTFVFADLRRWASFSVVEDPGYLMVCVSLWLGLGALLLRYIPDLRTLFGTEPSANTTPEQASRGNYVGPEPSHQHLDGLVSDAANITPTSSDK